MKNKVKIGIADDSGLLRTALKLFLVTHDFDVVIEAAEGNELLKKLYESQVKPAICILDANMPNGLGGIETTIAIKSKWPTMKVIGYSDDDLKGNIMLESGADAYLPKHSSEKDMVKCIADLVKCLK
jgi:DNA-binding NarL/FixJ family response regulator